MNAQNWMILLYILGIASGLFCGWWVWRLPVLNMEGAGRDMEVVDSLLGLAPLPLVRMEAGVVAEINREADARGLIPSAYIRELLLKRGALEAPVVVQSDLKKDV